MPLIEDGGWVADAWSRAPDHEPIPAAGDVIVPLCRLEEAEASHRSGRLGVDLPNDRDGAELVPWFDRIALIAVDFPSSGDGRGFSIARRLRRLGFAGELRACGRLIADQYAFARASGFDQVEVDGDIAARQPEEHWTAAAAAMSLRYQRGGPESAPASIPEARRG